jgi:hypothetical protein
LCRARERLNVGALRPCQCTKGIRRQSELRRAATTLLRQLPSDKNHRLWLYEDNQPRDGRKWQLRDSKTRFLLFSPARVAERQPIYLGDLIATALNSASFYDGICDGES